MKAQLKEASPTNLLFYSPISCAPLFHLSFSPDNDEIKVLAVLIFFFVLAALISNYCFFSYCT